MTGRSRRADVVHAAHLVHGAVLLVRPAVVAALADGGARDRTVVVVRVLGARHLVQGLAGLGAPRYLSPGRGAVVDGLHAMSMAGLALLDRAHRRGATVSALVAGAFVASGWWAALRG